MFNQFAIALLLYIGLILNCSNHYTAASSRNSDANGNIFNLLIGLYKINPMKGSPVFQSFSNSLLRGMGRDMKDKPILNFQSGENLIANEQMKMYLNEIEKVIHKNTIKPVKNYEIPAYDLGEVETENFKADVVIDNQIMSMEELQKSLNNHNVMEDFNSLFEHIGSKENDTEMPVTKLLPVNHTIIKYETVSGLRNAKNSSIDHISPAISHDRNRKEVFMDNAVEGLEDVIVF